MSAMNSLLAGGPVAFEAYCFYRTNIVAIAIYELKHGIFVAKVAYDL